MTGFLKYFPQAAPVSMLCISFFLRLFPNYRPGHRFIKILLNFLRQVVRVGKADNFFILNKTIPQAGAGIIHQLESAATCQSESPVIGACRSNLPAVPGGRVYRVPVDIEINAGPVIILLNFPKVTIYRSHRINKLRFEFPPRFPVADQDNPELFQKRGQVVYSFKRSEERRVGKECRYRWEP